MSDDPASPDRAAPTSEYVVVARRYRPQLFEELIGQGHVAKAMEQAIRTGRIGHAYLFTGARGVGKTSAARIFAKALNCESGPTPTPCNNCDACRMISLGEDVDVLEIDGASNRGIDEIRQLRQNAGIRPSRSRFKVYIIDEVHMLTKEAFNALLKTLEEPPEHVKFVFATTEPNKIPITILSRCQRFDFAGINAQAIGQRLEQVAAAEGVAIDQDALQLLAIRAAGSMRDSQSLLEQLLAVSEDRITSDSVTTLLGIAPSTRIEEVVERLTDRDAGSALAAVDAAVRGGADATQLLDQLIGYYRDLMAAAVGCPAEQMLHALPAQYDKARELGKAQGISTLLACLQVLDQTAARMRTSMHERTLLDMAIVRIAELQNLDELSQVIANLEAGVATEAQAPPPISEPPRRAAPVPERPATNAAPPPSPPAKPEQEGAGLAEQLAELQSTPDSKPKPQPRVSRRQQQAQAVEQPYVARAIELFEAEPDKIRYNPPPPKSDS